MYSSLQIKAKYSFKVLPSHNIKLIFDLILIVVFFFLCFTGLQKSPQSSVLF